MRTARLSPADRRRQVVESARASIAERGLATMSLRDIAAAAGVSVGTVTYHFSSVDEILVELVMGESERFYGAAIEQADADPDPLAALGTLTAPMFADTADARAHWRIWADYWVVVGRRPEVASAYSARVRRWEACAVRVVARGQHAGAYAATLPPDEAALRLAAYSDGLGLQLAQGAGGLRPATALAWMLEFADALLLPTGDRRHGIDVTDR